MKQKRKSNMYDWVNDCRNFLGGECEHKCCYCYCNAMKKKFPNLMERYSGEIRLLEKEFKRNLGKGKTIFVQNMGDLFADNVPEEFIRKVLEHCKQYPENIYVFQSKNPKRMLDLIDYFPENCWLGTTCESNREYPEISKAPSPKLRAGFMRMIKNVKKHFKIFLTLEPILDFDVEEFAQMIIDAKPDFVNIGSDSKKTEGLPEPSKDKIEALIKILKDKTEIKIKDNLGRLL